MFNFIKTVTIVIGFALGSLALALPAAADPLSWGARSKVITFNDLDLTTTAGRQAAQERIHQVARHLCMAVSNMSDLSHQVNFVSCVESATAIANRQLEAMVDRSKATKLANNAPK